MSEDVLLKWNDMIRWADTWTEQIRKESPVEQARYNYQRCIAALAAEVLALRTERDEIKRKASEQSEYIQSHGLTEFEMARLKALVAELGSQVKRWEDFFAVTEEAAEDCRTGVPLLTHEQVFGVTPVPNETDGLPKGEG